VFDLPIGGVTLGLARLLVAEIDKLQLLDCRRKLHVTRERYAKDPEHDCVGH
jgi:hypothetical protein